MNTVNIDVPLEQLIRADYINFPTLGGAFVMLIIRICILSCEELHFGSFIWKVKLHESC